MSRLNQAHLADRLRSIVKSGGIYLFFSLLNRAIPFLLLPLLTAYIPPEGYGMVSVIMVIMSIAMPVLGMCSNAVLFQKFYKLDDLGRAYFINDSYKIIVINTVLACLLAIPLFPVIEAQLKMTLGWFEIGILCAATGMIATLTTSLFQIKKQALNYGLFQFANAVTNVGFTLVFVVALEMSWQGRIWGILISSIFISALAIYLNWKNSDISLSHIKESPQMGGIYKLGGALIPSTIAGWAIAMSDRLLLTSLTSLEVVGIYAVGVMIGQITDVFLNALAQAYQPHIFQNGQSRDAHARIRLVQGVYLVVVVALLTVVGVTLVAPLIMKYMINARYHEAVSVVGCISLSYALFAIAAIFHSLVLVVEKNHVTIYVSLITLLVNLSGNYVLIKEFGMMGAAMGNALSAFVFMVLLIIASQRFNKLPWFDKQVFHVQ